jgi:hypothetical protein
MSEIKDKAKKEIDKAAGAAKTAAGHVVDASKNVAHQLGRKMKEGGKRLQKV